MVAWVAVIVFDVALVVFGRDALSTVARRFARRHPIAFGMMVSFVLAHWCRSDRFERYDPLSRMAVGIATVRPTKQ